MGIEAAEVPAFDDLPEEYSPEVWDTAWLNFERAYTHARIAYRLRERQGNTFWSTAKEILGGAMGGDGEANVRYDGVTYLVPVSIGQGIAEEVLGDAPSRIGAIREPSEEIHEQEIGELEDFIHASAAPSTTSGSPPTARTRCAPSTVFWWTSARSIGTPTSPASSEKRP